MKSDKMLEVCTSEALQKAMDEKEGHEKKIAAAQAEKAGLTRSLEEAQGKLAALDAKEQAVKALRLERQNAIAKGKITRTSQPGSKRANRICATWPAAAVFWKTRMRPI